MTNKQIREQSRLDLQGKWLKLALFTLITFAITIAARYFTDDFYFHLLISLAINAIVGTFYKAFYINFYKTKEIDLKKGFPNIKVFLRYFGLYLLLCAVLIIITLIIFFLSALGFIGVAMAIDFNNLFNLGNLGNTLPSLIIIYIGIIIIFIFIVLFYFAAPFLVVQGNGVFKSIGDSIRLMRGKKWRLFKLQLSFIGWGILSVLSLGVGLLWLVPYYCESIITFYFKVVMEEE